MKLSTKLPASILALTTVTAGVTAYIAYDHSSGSLTDQAEANLDGLLNTKETALQDWLLSIEQDLDITREQPFVQNAINDFSAGWLQLGESQQLIYKTLIFTAILTQRVRKKVSSKPQMDRSTAIITKPITHSSPAC